MSVVVLDASAAVELLLGTVAGGRVRRCLRRKTVAVPGHLEAEVLSALGRLSRGGAVGEERVGVALARRLEATLLTADTRLARAPDLGIALTLV